MGQTILELHDIVKTFPGVLALNGINFCLLYTSRPWVNTSPAILSPRGYVGCSICMSRGAAAGAGHRDGWKRDGGCKLE